ncbi:hypothetical protein FHS43_001344 [Streptosporangium becharense]|uniref:Uncharacterized protein n=1 Tax=Streptosporangium becharense TaxID=1816182 RepID=A0A7W9IDX6_9ACTN|nr:hypothetical protein [Streptosporangium becharense]MBB5818947.1 hypothetical protein [Streptosporangium becharense]
MATNATAGRSRSPRSVKNGRSRNAMTGRLRNAAKVRSRNAMTGRLSAGLCMSPQRRTDATAGVTCRSGPCRPCRDGGGVSCRPRCGTRQSCRGGCRALCNRSCRTPSSISSRAAWPGASPSASPPAGRRPPAPVWGSGRPRPPAPVPIRRPGRRGARGRGTRRFACRARTSPSRRGSSWGSPGGRRPARADDTRRDVPDGGAVETFRMRGLIVGRPTSACPRCRSRRGCPSPTPGPACARPLIRRTSLSVRASTVTGRPAWPSTMSTGA